MIVLMEKVLEHSSVPGNRNDNHRRGDGGESYISPSFCLRIDVCNTELDFFSFFDAFNTTTQPQGIQLHMCEFS